jgi:CdiI immunity protein
MVMSAPDESPLRTLFGGFFHQDWQYDGPIPEVVVDKFAANYSAADVPAAQRAVQDLLDRDLSVDELERVLDRAGMNYYPPGVGQTHREFLTMVGDRLAGFMSARGQGHSTRR